MRLAHIKVLIDGPQMTENEAMRFCEQADIDGEIADKILAIVKNHILDHVDPEIADLVKIVVD